MGSHWKMNRVNRKRISWNVILNTSLVRKGCLSCGGIVLSKIRGGILVYFGYQVMQAREI